MMTKKRLISLLPTLFVIGVVSAITIIGTVYGVMYFKKTIVFGDIMLQEEKELLLAYNNYTINEPLKLKTKCYSGGDTIMAKVRNPLGSSIPSVDLELNGTTVLNGANQTLEAGQITLYVRGIRQGRWNCSFSVINSTNTRVVFADDF